MYHNGTAVDEPKATYSTNGSGPQLTDRLPPHDQDAENALLGSLLADGRRLAEVQDSLKAEHFYRDSNGAIYQAMITLYGRSEPIDTVTVAAELRRMGKQVDDSGERYLSWLQSIVPAGANVVSYALIIEENAIRRNMIRAASKIGSMAYQVETPIAELVNEAELTVLSLQKDRTGNLLVTQEETAGQFVDDLLSDELPGLRTGYLDLDRLIGGLEPGFGYWFCGAEKMGKTSLLNGMSLYNAKQGKVVLRISVEMSSKQRMRRDVAAETGIPISKLRSRDLTKEELDKAIDTVERLRKLPLITADNPGARPHEVKAAITQAMRKFGHLDLIELDYWQRLEPDKGNGGDSAAEKLEQISRAIHNIIKDKRVNVPLVGSAQVVSKSIDARQNKRPQTSDVFGSSGLMKDATMMAYIYRDDYYNPDTTERPNIAEIDVKLNRDGPTGVVDLYWHGATASFKNLTRREINL